MKCSTYIYTLLLLNDGPCIIIRARIITIICNNKIIYNFSRLRTHIECQSRRNWKTRYLPRVARHRGQDWRYRASKNKKILLNCDLHTMYRKSQNGVFVCYANAAATFLRNFRHLPCTEADTYKIGPIGHWNKNRADNMARHSGTRSITVSPFLPNARLCVLQTVSSFLTHRVLSLDCLLSNSIYFILLLLFWIRIEKSIH